MIVYGDTIAVEPAAQKRAWASGALRRAAAAPADLRRHGWLVAALIEWGELVQGLRDRAFAGRGDVDAGDPEAQACGGALLRLAAAVGRSWDGADPGDLLAGAALLDAVALPRATLRVRVPEGFAHYALFPEAYWVAARRRGPSPTAVVIGLRSIGTTLAATVAAALDTACVSDVRPVGHPFARTLSLGPALREAWAARNDRPHAVVDEGPGLSGSSFGAAADTLESVGVPRAALTFYPGHAGDLGPEAAAGHRARWATVPRPSLTLHDIAGPGAPDGRRLAHWARDLVGPVRGDPVDLSGGGWRQHLRGDTAHIPMDAQNERLKVRLDTSTGPVLMRFSGLGRRGHARLGTARALAEAGFGLPPLGWRHGFLLEPWRGDARPLRADNGQDREAVLARLPGYLAFRAAHLPAPAGGATAAALHAMARANIAKACGEAAATALDRFSPATLDAVDAHARPVCTDARLHAWEWIKLPDGTVLKTDALDHHAGHDLVGAQDIAWDLAGARVEWSLSRAEADTLAAAVASRTGRGFHPKALALHAYAYLGFQLGLARMAWERAAPAERPALDKRLAFLRDVVDSAARAGGAWR